MKLVLFMLMLSVSAPAFAQYTELEGKRYEPPVLLAAREQPLVRWSSMGVRTTSAQRCGEYFLRGTSDGYDMVRYYYRISIRNDSRMIREEFRPHLFVLRTSERAPSIQQRAEDETIKIIIRAPREVLEDLRDCFPEMPRPTRTLTPSDAYRPYAFTERGKRRLIPKDTYQPYRRNPRDEE